MSWASVKLSDLASVSSGGGAPQDADSFSAEGIPFVRAGSLVKLLDGQPEQSLELLQPDVAADHKLKLFPAGTVLFAKSGMSATKGHIYQLQKPAYVVNHLAALIPRSEITGRYLRHVLQFKSPTCLIKDEAYPSIRLGDIEDMEVPAPTTEAEQKRIAAVLDQADDLRRKRQRALDRLNQLGQAIFIEMFGDSPPEAQQSLASVCDLITDGTHYTPTYSEEGVVFLSAKNVTKRRIDWQNVKYIPEHLHIELQRRVSPKMNDVLLAKNGTTGVAALVDRDCIFDIYVSLALLRPSKRILPRYLLEAVNCDMTRRQFDGSLKGIGVSNLHLVDIRAAMIPVPSLDQQYDFVQRVELLERLRQSLERSLSEAEALFVSLQHRVFRGELTDPSLKEAVA